MTLETRHGLVYPDTCIGGAGWAAATGAVSAIVMRAAKKVRGMVTSSPQPITPYRQNGSVLNCYRLAFFASR